LAALSCACDADPAVRPKVHAAFSPDPALESRLTALIAAMTLEQKVGQLIQPDIASITPEDLRHFPLGSILNGGNSSPNGDEFAPPGKWLALADGFYDPSMGAAHGSHPTPTLWGTDTVHGHDNIVGATIFPHNIGLGAARDSNLVRWGRPYESYSESPEVVREHAAAMVLGLQGVPGSAEFLDASHVIATPKPLVGDGGTGGRDQGDNAASEEGPRDVPAAGYPPAIAAGVQTAMASFPSRRLTMRASRH